jgi:superfamily II DNA or RNA helicase
VTSGLKKRARPTHKVLYLLSLSADRQLSLSPVRAPLAGVIGEISPLPLSLIDQETRPAYLAEADFNILLDLAQRCELLPGLTWYPLPASADGLFRKVLATGRGRWEDAAGPRLARGDALLANVSWKILPSGSQVLRFELPDNAGAAPWRHLPLHRPWVVDTVSGTCRPVKVQGASEEHVVELLARGPIDPEEVEAVSRDLRAASAGVPELRAIPVQRKEPSAPIAVLRLRNVEVGRGGRFLVRPAVSVEFDYDGLSLPWDFEGDSRFISASETQGAQVIRITRGHALEDACMERLERLGLRSLAMIEVLDHRPDQGGLLVVEDGNENSKRWAAIQRELARLEASNCLILRDPDLVGELLVPDAWRCRVEPDQGDWIRLNLEILGNGRSHGVLDAIAQWARDSNPMLLQTVLSLATPKAEELLSVGERYLLTLSHARLERALAAVVELTDQSFDGHAEGLRVRRGRLADLAALPPEWELIGDDRLAQVARQLDELSIAESPAQPAGLQAKLRDYQRKGVTWLQFLRETGFGGILADDMGLGKTVQSLANILTEQQAGRLDRPVLVVAPTSLMHNWRSEAKRFAPGLRVLTLHGSERRGRFQWIPDSDLVLTTYPLLSRDITWLEKSQWHQVILDEAQAIKNPRTRAARAARRLKTRHRLCLTGTPVENHLGELWSQFDFLMPGLLGSESQFKAQFRQPIEKMGSEERRAVLARRIRPFFLRRTKAEVAPELPPKTEIVKTVPLVGSQHRLYQSMRAEMHERIRSALKAQGPDRGRIVILDALLRLRQICCDPRLVEGGARSGSPDSAKMQLLMDLVPEMVIEGRRILLFSQFVRMLELIEVELDRRNIPFVKLTGQTRDRPKVIEAFQRGEVPVFLISLRAGGVGLNLTAADTVIHYDPWWNPAVEDQATDRAHRIGQDRKVFVYRLLTENTIEERVQRLQASKRDLIEGLLGGGGAINLGPEELELLLGTD